MLIGPANFVGGFAAELVLYISDDDGGALIGESLSDGGANAARSPGYEGGFVLESLHERSFNRQKMRTRCASCAGF